MEYNLVGAIMDYECGEMESMDQVLELFSHLIKSGKIYHLQGSYGRAANTLVETGHLDRNGNIL